MAIEIARLIATVGADTGEFEQKMDQAGNTVGRFSGVARTALIGAAAAGGAALVGLGVKSASVAADFEGQMNILSVAAGGSAISLDELRQAALLVGADTQLVGVSASEAADAMTGFYKAGLTTTDIFGNLNQYLEEGTNLNGALRAAVDLAAASELDLAAASDVVSVAMATFGLGAEDATAIADSFVGAADASVASVSDLAEAMTNVGPTAASFGWSLEDTNTALALLSTRGITGAEAGTALKSMMTNLTSGTSATTEALNDLGVSLYNTDGTMRALPDIISQLSTSMSGLTDEQRNQYVQTLAGTYGMKAMNTLLAEGTTGWQEMDTAIASAASSQEVGAARTQGFHAAMEQLQGTLETFMIEVGTPLIENFLTPAVRLLTNLASRLVDIVPPADQVTAALDNTKAALGSFVAEMQAFLGDPLGYIKEHWEDWQSGIEEAGADATTAAVSGLSANAEDWGTNLGTFLGEGMRSAFLFLKDDVPVLAKELWETISSLVTTMVTPENITSLGQSLLTFFTSAFDSFITALTADPQWKEKVTAWFDSTVVAPVKDIDLIQPGKDAIQGFIDGVNAKIEDIETAISDMVGRIVNPFKNIDLKSIGSDLMAGLKEGIAGAAGGVADAAKDAAGSAVDTAKDFLGIGSPSKVFELMGRNLMEGMALGIERESYRPAQAVTNTSRDVTNHYQYNLNATYQQAPATDPGSLLRQLVLELRRQGIAAPLPDVGMP